MSSDKPSKNEDEYFAREDAERLARLRAHRQAEQTAAERKSHLMKCPRCGADLQAQMLRGIHLERCPECHGVWLDDGELDLLVRNDDPGVLGRVMGDLWTTLKRHRGHS